MRGAFARRPVVHEHHGALAPIDAILKQAPLNYGGYSSPEVDAWLDEARIKTNLAERKAVYQKIAEKLQNDGSIVYLYHRLMIIAHSARLEGYAQLPDGLIRLQGVKLK